MIEDLFDSDMATDQSKKLAKEMCFVMKEIRESSTNKDTGKSFSIRNLCSQKDLDFSVMSRAENPKESTIPTLSFFLDWCELLNVELGDVVKKAQKRLKQSDVQK